MSMLNDVKLEVYRLQARIKALADYGFSEDIELRIHQQIVASIELVQLTAELRALKKLLQPGAKLL